MVTVVNTRDHSSNCTFYKAAGFVHGCGGSPMTESGNLIVSSQVERRGLFCRLDTVRRRGDPTCAIVANLVNDELHTGGHS